jgi:hypothetical protein
MTARRRLPTRTTLNRKRRDVPVDVVGIIDRRFCFDLFTPFASITDVVRISLNSPLWFAGIRHLVSRVFAAFSEAAPAADAGRQFIP